MEHNKPIPKQYKKQAEYLIHQMGELAEILWPFISELGDSVEIESESCLVKISKRQFNMEK